METISIPDKIDGEMAESIRQMIISRNLFGLNRNEYSKVKVVYNNILKQKPVKVDKIIRNILYKVSDQPDIYFPGNEEIMRQKIATFMLKFAKMVNIDIEALKTNCRDRTLCEYRQMSWKFCSERIIRGKMTKTQFFQLLADFYNRDRCTVIHGIKTITNTPTLNKTYQSLVNSFSL
jgi:chromosomal replication initiation ATPase DnaA